MGISVMWATHSKTGGSHKFSYYNALLQQKKRERMFKDFFSCIFLFFLFLWLVFRAITLGLSKLCPTQFQNSNFVQLFHAIYYHCYNSASVHCTYMNTEWLNAMFSCFWTMSRGVHMVRSFHVHKYRGCEKCLVKKYIE